MPLVKRVGSICVINEPTLGEAYDWAVSSRSPTKVDPFAMYIEYRKWNDDVLAICGASSAGSEQPRFRSDGRRVYTQQELGRCCSNRLLHTMALRPHAKKGWLAKESGIVRITDIDSDDREMDGFVSRHDIDFCIMLLQTRDGTRTMHFSSGLEVPEGALDASEESGYTRTAGMSVTEMLSTLEHVVNHQDWYPEVTTNDDGTAEMSRKGTLYHGVRELFGRHECKRRQRPQVDAWNARRRAAAAK